MISERISCVTDFAHRLDVALGNSSDSYVDAYIMDDSVFDMEEIDVQVQGFEEEEEPSPEDVSKSSSCYQSASSSNCSWNSLSPANTKTTALEQLDMKPMDDFRDYVNFTPTPSKLFLQTSCTPSSGVGSSTSGGSIGGLSPNSSEDSGFGTGLRVYNGASKLFVKPDEQPTPTPSVEPATTTASMKMDELLGAPRFRSSICYARSASCDSLF